MHWLANLRVWLTTREAPGTAQTRSRTSGTVLLFTVLGTLVLGLRLIITERRRTTVATLALAVAVVADRQIMTGPTAAAVGHAHRPADP